ncbi:transcription factor S-II, central domain-containing protein, partial [Radiomyces spectabilis]|uniref:transcription factor S-II, central domain-containing protein n=1 Tax=Radiomyces spectabilis TaxID=64574 RepID=UPI00221E4CC7
TVEENPIRKNVIRNMSNTLKSIIENALEKDPTLFESSDSPDNVLKATALAEELAKSIEEAMYTKLADAVPGKPGRILCGERYKSKFRSLLYNLKDKANEIFQMRVVTGDLVPEELARMSSEDMANPELKSMSETLRKKSIKDSVLKLQNMPIIKKTHKGDIIMIPNKETNFSEEQQPPPPPSPLSVDIHDRKRDYNDITKSDDATNSRKSSMSATPSTPTTAKTDPLDNILARIGVHADGTSDTANNDRNKKRKVTLDVEQLLGDEDIQLEIGSDDEGVITTRRTVNEHGEEVYEPERKKSEEPKPPVIWRGRVNMPQVAEFEGSARQIGGRTLSEAEWMDVLSPTMWIEGRIPRDRVTDYVTQTQYSTSREIVLLVIEPEPRQPSTSADVAQANHQQAQSLLHYFESRKRYGVVGHNKTKIKDFYLLPLYKTQDIPDCLYVVRVDEIQRECDLFLGVLVISKSVYTAPSFV